MTTTLIARNLRVTYGQRVIALDGVDVDLLPGRVLAVVGESGSGKTSLGRALLGLCDGADVTGSVRLGDQELVGLSESAWRPLRWQRLAMAFQSTGAMNPMLTVGDQVGEPLREHRGVGLREADERAARQLERVGLGEWAMTRFPHQLSGGQKRLAQVAMALVCDPEVVILDEPTAGLDPLARQRLIALLGTLSASRTMSLVILTHDLGLTDALADEVMVLYRGWIAEQGPADDVLRRPRSPFAVGLLGAAPTLSTVKELRGIRAPVPGRESDTGCPFSSRCTQAISRCVHERPPLAPPTGESGPRTVACLRGGLVTLLAARHLAKTYRLRSSVRTTTVEALIGVDLEVRHGEVVGIVGTNGAGKTTLALALAHLVEPDRGEVVFEGEPVAGRNRQQMLDFRRRVQLVQQDPYESLSAHFDVTGQLTEPLEIQGLPRDEDRLVAALAAVRLPTDAEFRRRHMHQLSGGQLQRLAVARALVLEPDVLVLDEPVSMLDPSEQAEMLSLLKSAQVQRGLSMVVISHEIAVIARVSDRIAVLHQGRIVETASGADIVSAPSHDMTRLLLVAAGWRPYATDDREALPLRGG